MKKSLIIVILFFIFLQSYSQTDSNSYYWCDMFHNYIEQQYPINKKIDLSKKRIKKIPRNILKDTLIEYLDISNHKIRNFKKKSAQLQHLPIKILRIQNCPEMQLPDFKYFPQLEILDLRNTTSYDDELIKKLHPLKNLKAVFYNGETCYDDTSAIWFLKKIEYLNFVGDYYIIEVPNRITDFNNLKGMEFYLHPNYQITEQIYELKNIEYLSLIIREFDTLQLKFAEFPKLKKIDIVSDSLSGLPDDIFQLKNLQHLNIYHHNFNLIEQKKIISKLPNTQVFFGGKEFYLVENKLRELNFPSVRGCRANIKFYYDNNGQLKKKIKIY